MRRLSVLFYIGLILWNVCVPTLNNPRKWGEESNTSPWAAKGSHFRKNIYSIKGLNKDF